MSRLRKELRHYMPHLIWMLAFSLAYSMFTYLLDVQLELGMTITQELYYLRGVLMIVPLVLFEISVKKTVKLWQYCLFSAVLLGAIQLVVGVLSFTLVALVICVMRGANRIKQQLQILDEELPEESILDHPTGFLILLPIAYYIIAGFSGHDFFQEMALYHLVAIVLCFFVDSGLQRFESYVRLSEMNANVPSQRILETGTRIFVVCALVATLFVVPIMRTQYEFQAFEFTFESSGGEWEEEETEIVEESEQSGGMGEMFDDSEPLIDLTWLWEILEFITVVGLYVGTLYLLFRWLRMVITNFNKTQVEKNDVIESTIDKDDEEVKTQRRRQRVADFFDFSEAMKIRRRYKKELKRYKPKSWQTPQEMEKMAQKDMPELHRQYEEVRYGVSSAKTE